MTGGAPPEGRPGVRTRRSLAKQYGELRARLVALASHVTRDGDEAEDVVQGVFVRLLERMRGGEPLDVTPGYLRGAVRREALQRHRNRAKRKDPGWTSAVVAEWSSAPTPREVLRIERLRELVGETMSELSSGQREAFRLVVLDGLSYATAAEELGTTVGSVRKQIYRARQAFRGRLASRGCSSIGDL